MSEKKVIQLPGTAPLPECPVTIIEDRDYCRHDRIIFDVKTRSISCSECFAALDPFDFLLKNAKSIQRAWQSHKAVMHKVSELENKVFSLKKEEKRLKASISRTKEKVTTVSVRGDA